MTFRKGDIIAYSPSHPFRRDGYAEVRIGWDTDEPYGQDTFDQRDTRLTPEELATGYVLFNLDDFVEQQFVLVEEYAPDDFFVLVTRKGIAKRTFIRRGARPLPEEAVAERRHQMREFNEGRARALLLSPSSDQELAASELPGMTADEVRALGETLQWCERARRKFETAFDHLVRMLDAGDNVDFQVVHTDEDHYELVRARRTLDKKLDALRS